MTEFKIIISTLICALFVLVFYLYSTSQQPRVNRIKVWEAKKVRRMIESGKCVQGFEFNEETQEYDMILKDECLPKH